MTPPSRPRSLIGFGAALRARRETLGFTQDLLAARSGISKPYLSNIETGRTPGPPSEPKLRALAKALRWNAPELLAAADWLRTPLSIRKAIEARDDADAPRRQDGAIDLDRLFPADGAPSEGQDGGGGVTSAEERPIPVRDVPVINRVAAGKASEYTDLDYPAGVADDYVPVPDLPDAPVRHAFALRVAGDSMAPRYGDGDFIIVGPGEAKDGDDCVVRLADGASSATTFKRIYFLRTGEDAEAAPHALRLVPLNPQHAERVVPIEEVTGIYPLMYTLTPAKRDGG